MKPELDTLIDRFRAAQDIGVDAFVRVLKLPLPVSDQAWISYCLKNGIQLVDQINGVPVYAHGHGIEIKLDGLTIDFDWGPNGEPDGFDAWRLYNFTLDNETHVTCTHLEVISWLEEAREKGEVVRRGHLYFDPIRRSTRASGTGRSPMNVTDFDGDVAVTNVHELRSRLESVRRGDDGAFILSLRPNGPSLWIHINGNVAHLHYFPLESEANAGYIPEPESGVGHENDVRFLLVGGDEGSAIWGDAARLVSLETAYAAATDFFFDEGLPKSVSWFEL